MHICSLNKSLQWGEVFNKLPLRAPLSDRAESSFSMTLHVIPGPPETDARSQKKPDPPSSAAGEPRWLSFSFRSLPSAAQAPAAFLQTDWQARRTFRGPGGSFDPQFQVPVCCDADEEVSSRNRKHILTAADYVHIYSFADSSEDFSSSVSLKCRRDFCLAGRVCL